ncbi:lamin tail domain-containing protein [Actinoplanes sp. NPDC049802]|uniref:lamin tail domain-containing protein n=1 Tax=Actinoplanes sp. NPDC049802 TaxID=3154742 RepID=UPI0033E4CD71
MLRRLTALAAAATLAAAGTAAPAAAVSAACRPAAGSPRCAVWTGRVVWVADGDTLKVDFAGDGTTAAESVRIIGVQAMEQTVYSPRPERRRGECHSLTATAALEKLVAAGGGRVRMTAQHPASSSRDRPLRSVAVRIGGQWRDLGHELIRQGHALWLPFSDEWAWDADYQYAAQQAATERRRLYDADTCGVGPAQDSGLTVWVNGDADGLDDIDLNGEWVRIGNPSTRDVPIGGWWIRDSGLRRYTFAAGTVAPAGGAVYVHIGRGRDTATHKYWGLTAPVFANIIPALHFNGDGGYLFDPQGDLRAWMIYPCLTGCGSPLTGRARLRVKPTGPELIELVNTGTEAVDLFGHVVMSKWWAHRFEERTVLAAGEAITVPLGGGRRILDDAGGVVTLLTADQWTVTCTAWGSGRC